MKPNRFDFEYNQPELYRQVMEYIPRVEGKPFIRICGFNGSCFLGTKMYELKVVEAWLEGKTDWAVSIDDHLDEIWPGFWISNDCLQLQPEFILDTYSKFFYIFTPELIAMTERGDLDFVDEFLRINSL